MNGQSIDNRYTGDSFCRYFAGGRNSHSLPCDLFRLGKMTMCRDFTLALACTVQFLILFLYIIMVATQLTGRELIYCANLRQVCLNHTHE